MADSTIDSERLWLIPGRFGSARTMSLPEDHNTLASSPTHNVVAPVEARIGDVIGVYNTGATGIKGYSEFVYGRMSADITAAAKQVCCQEAVGVPFTFSNAKASVLDSSGDPRAVITISAMTDDYYGWFWCGGVCPEFMVSGMGGTYATDGNVEIGPIASVGLSGTGIGLGPVSGDTVAFCGFAEAAD